MTCDTEKTRTELLEEIDRLKGMVESDPARVFFDLAPLPYQSLDGEARIINVNNAWLTMLGYDKEAVLGQSIREFLTPDSIELLKTRFCTFLAKGEVRHAEFTMIRQDGARILVNVNGRIGYDDLGNFQQTHCILNDITEIRRAEVDLLSSEQRFRGLFESSIDGIVYTDITGTILNINPPFCAMLGATSENLLGKHILDITPKDWHDVESKLFHSKVMQDGFCDSFKKEYYHTSGRRVPVSIRLWLNRDEADRPIGVWGIAKDISQEVKVTEALKQSEHQYQRIVETANEGILGLDVSNRIVFANQVVADFLGYPHAELLGMSFYDVIRPEDRDIQEACFSRRAQGIRERYERAFARKDGVIGWGLVSASTLLNELGAYTGSFAMITDITDRKRTEAELLESERKYRDIFENSVEGIFQTTPEGRFVNANPALARMMGYDSPADLIESVTDIATQFYAVAEERLAFIDKLERRDKVQDYELQLRRKDGSTLWISENVRVVRDASGSPILFEGSMVDITMRKLTQEALRLTQFSVDNAPVDIYWINEEGYFIYVNDHTCKSVGYSREELLNMTIMDINPEILAEDWPLRWERRRRDNLVQFESVHQRKDGSEFPVGVTSHYKVHDGQEYLFTYAYDLTKREEGEEALRRSQELLNEVQRMSLTGGWEVDMKSGEITWTEGQYALHGMAPNDDPVNVQNFFERSVHPDDRPALAESWASLIREKIPVEMEYRVVRADGSTAIFLSMGIPDVDDAGVVRRVFGTSRDVTMERQSAQELQQSHQRLLTILDGIDADIYVSDLQGNDVLFMNAHMRENFGSPDSGAKCFEIFRGEREQCSFCPKPRLLDEDGDPIETVISERYNPLTKRWYLNHDRAIQWLEGRLVHMHMAADITDLKGMEEELKLAMTQAKAASLSKNEFLANMSHEIRTPLNGLLGMLQLLQLTSLVAEQRNYLDTAVDSGRNLLQILNDILDLSKIESGKLEFDNQTMELSEVLDSVVAVFRHQAESRGLDMAWKIDESLPRHFKADKGRLRQILFNLVGNSAKFTDSGSVIVEAYPMPTPLKDGKTQLYFSVADTGIGIPDDKINQIFDPFTQVDGSFTRKYQGTGLGLGIVRRLVSLMGGTIAVNSEEGKGTTIVFTLAVHSAEPGPLNHPSLSEATENRRLTILVAEDEHVNRIVIQRLLSKMGHNVVCVEDGETAVETLRTASFDCVITDIQMPGMDGLETTRAIREELKLDIPVIALTAHAMKGDRKRFIEAGMDGYMSKPFEMGELQEELARIMMGSGRE